MTVSIYFLISVAIGLLTIYFRSDLGNTEIIPDYSLIDKAFVISFSIVKYISKVFYPVGLTAIDAFPAKSAGGMFPFMVYLSPALIVVAGIFMLRYLKKAPIIVFGLMFFFLNIIVTQISFLEDGFCANRYFYLSSVGIFLAIGVATTTLYKIVSSHRYLMISGCFILMFLLAGITHSRSENWKNTWSLSSSIIENSPDVAMAYNMRGVWYYGQQEYESSVEDFNKVIDLFPGYSAAYFNRGLSLKGMQNFSSAIEDYNRAIELNPYFVSAFIGRGVLYLDIIKDYPSALEDFNQVISLDPKNARAYYNRGLVYLRMRNLDEACKNWFRVKELGYSQADDMIKRFCR